MDLDERLKKEIYTYCCGLGREEYRWYDEEAVIPANRPVWNALERYGFDFDMFMTEKGYELIGDEELRTEFMMYMLSVLDLPVSRYMTDWINGYLDFFRRDSGDITYTEILHRLYLCRTDEDIWQLLAEGIGNADSLYAWYMGMYDKALAVVTGVPCYCEKDERKAAEFRDYMIKAKKRI